MNIRQGDIWLVRFYPKVGQEITKIRPAVIISHDHIGRLPLKTIIPITEWKDRYQDYPWMVKLSNTSSNGLKKDSAIDCFQIKNFSNDRFVEKIGEIDYDLLFEVHNVVAKTLNPNYSITL